MHAKPRADLLTWDSDGRGAGKAAWVLFPVFFVFALALYQPALQGPFITDDNAYLVGKPWMQELSIENLRAILDPRGAPAISTANWAPAHLIGHALEIQIFGDDLLGYHVVNVVLHALNSVLLILILCATAVPPFVALCGGLLFLLHPANVEAVAWISQLKTQLAFAFALAALLLHSRRPALGATLFSLALLAKASALFALPVAALFAWTRGGPLRERPRWGWLAVWSVLFLAYAVPELAMFRKTGEASLAEASTLLSRVLLIPAITGRYAVLAVSSWGTATSHAPDAPATVLDPWWILGAVVLAAAAARALWTLHRRDVECAYWAWAVAAYVPVSQIFPFIYPMADRYLYFILPGLLGAAAVATRTSAGRWGRAVREGGARALPAAAHVSLGLVLLLGFAFAVHAHRRAAVWQSGALWMQDAAEEYPDGIQANLLRASELAKTEEVDGAVAALERARTRGYGEVDVLLADPYIGALRGNPDFDALIARMAATWIENLQALEEPTRIDLRRLGNAHLHRREYALAVEAFERALELPGLGDDWIVRGELLRARGALGRTRAAGEDDRNAPAQPEGRSPGGPGK